MYYTGSAVILAPEWKRVLDLRDLCSLRKILPFTPEMNFSILSNQL